MTKKTFNITGNCIASLHYMMDNSEKVNAAYALVEQGYYYTISRPRQYGKTTTLFAIAERLLQTSDYLPILLNFQGIDDKWHHADEAFAMMFINEVCKSLEFVDNTLYTWLENYKNNVTDLNSLSAVITELVRQTPKKLVVLIDEVDSSSNYLPFLHFLALLRAKYLQRQSPQHHTFYSVVLVGVHDIKSLKYKIRNPDETHFNSPWNIAIDFESNMEFKPHEIVPMLAAYSQAEQVPMDTAAIAQRLYHYTSGYPFLICRLCQLISTKLLPQQATPEWTTDLVDKAATLIAKEINTNFDSLTKNLANHPDLMDLVFKMLLQGQSFSFNPHNETIRKGVTYGIFKQNGQLKIHNRIYEQVIYNYLISKEETEDKNKVDNYVQGYKYEKADHSLDFVLVLQRFQVYMKENHSLKDGDFLEKHWRLLFLAFLRPILNGRGHDFKEAQVSLERRIDVIITYDRFLYVVELKRWYGEEAHQEGLQQLCDYLEALHLDTGFLLLFDHRKEQQWKQTWIETQGKKIFAVWV